MKIRFENHDLVTEGCGQFIDLTDEVVQVVKRVAPAVVNCVRKVSTN